MTAAQNNLFHQLVQGAGQMRADLHEVAWTVLGVLLLTAIVGLSALGIWILKGGFSRNFSCLSSPEDRRILEDWLRE